MKVFKPRFHWQTFLKALTLCLSTAVTLLFCEIVLRLVLHSTESNGYYIFPPNLKVVFKPSPEIMPGVFGDAEFATNSLGLRGDELTPQHTYRILAIGGSTTIGAFLDQSETWTCLLEGNLNRNIMSHRVWVGNGGVSGLTTNHHLMAMQHLFLRALRIDAVILLVGVNDFSNRIAHENDYDPSFIETPEAKDELLAQTFTGTFDSYANDPWHKRTAIWQTLRKAKKLISRRHIEDERGTIYITWREHRQHAAEIRDALPDLSPALGRYAKNINKMIDIAREKSIRSIFMTQPTMWKPGLPQNLSALLWLGGIGDFQKESGKPYYSVSALANGMKAYNDTLLRVCQERNTEYLDLASMFEKDTTVFYDDAHFNESGARKVALALSQYLIVRGPFRESQVAGHRK